MSTVRVHHRLAVAGAALALVLTVAACSGSPAGSGATESPASPNSSSRAVASATPQAGFAADSAAIRDAMDALVDDGVAPGVVVAIRHHDRVRVLAAGKASTSTQESMSTSHVFRIGSISKTMVAVAIHNLAQRGLLSLDDTIEKWLPGLVPHGGDITLAQLLDHTSGIANYTDTSVFASVDSLPAKPMPPRELVALGTSQGPLFKPGTSAHYSNTGYVLLALVIERVTGHPLSAALQRFVFTPAHMTSSHQGGPAPGAPVAHGYDAGDDVTDVPLAWAWGAGDVVADAGDVASFFHRLLDGQLVAPNSLARMQEAGRGLPEIGYTGYGLGLGQTETVCGTAWGHEGQLAGFTSFAWNNPDQDRGVVILTNATVDDADRAFQDLTNIGLCGTDR